jgi:hypothetical protein
MLWVPPVRILEIHTERRAPMQVCIVVTNGMFWEISVKLGEGKTDEPLQLTTPTAPMESTVMEIL